MHPACLISLTRLSPMELLSVVFGFKSKSSTVLCTTMVTETIQYYTENGCKGVFLLLLDASKAFDKVVFHMLFNELIN